MGEPGVVPLGSSRLISTTRSEPNSINGCDKGLTHVVVVGEMVRYNQGQEVQGDMSWN